MKKIILSIVFILGMTTIGNAENNLVINDNIVFEFSEDKINTIQSINIADYDLILSEYLSEDFTTNSLIIATPFGYCKIIANAIGGLLEKTGMNDVVVDILVDALEKICKELA